MSRIQSLQKLLATEPNPDIKAGYKREIAALTGTSRSAMKKRGARFAQDIKKSELPWVNLDDDYPVVMGDDGTWKYVAAADEGGTPYFVGFDDHTTSGVIVYAGDEEEAEEMAAEAILAANPNYFQDENSFMEENGVDSNTVDWDKTSSDEIVGQHGGTMIYINGAGYVSTTGSPTVRRLKRPTPPKSAVDALAKVKAAATEFSTKYADQLKGNVVGTSYLSRDLRYFLGTQGKDERDELIDSLEKSITFEQKYQGDPEEAGPSDFLPDAQALLAALKAFRFPSEGASKAARPAMRKGGAPSVRKAGSVQTFSFDELDPKAQKKALDKMRQMNAENWDWESVMGDDEGMYIDLKDKFGITAEWKNLEFDHQQGTGAFPGATINRDFIMQSAGLQDVESADGGMITDEMRSEIRIDRNGNLEEDDLPVVAEWKSPEGKFYQEFTSAAKDILSEAGSWLAQYAAKESEFRDSEEALKEDIEGNDIEFYRNGDVVRRDHKAAKPAMKKAAYPGKVGQPITVSQVPDNAQFISDSQDVNAVRESVGSAADGYDSFFVIVGDGDYAAVWGMSGIVPRVSKLVTRLV